MALINIHSHAAGKYENEFTIVNLMSGFDRRDHQSFYSAGIHPCFINEKHVAEAFNLLSEAAQTSDIIAIGECGLDRLCDTDLELQKHWFRKQVLLASHCNKPLIIHCVRAFAEVMEILDDAHFHLPVIFHGFNKNDRLAGQLLSKGYYLSFGRHLMHENIQRLFRNIPSDRVFLETDSSNVAIEDIYSLAALAKETNVETLEVTVDQNFLRVFGIKIKHNE